MDSLQIVIVEDEVIVAEDLRQTLTLEGYNITGCYESAENALVEIRKSLPDLLMIDIRLKGAMTGIDLAQEVRKQANVPIIYVTANSDEETYRLARLTKPQAFLVKPFNSRTLLASVDLALYNFSTNHEAESIIESSSIERNDFQSAINDGLFVRIGGKHRKIKLSDFLYIEADGSYINIITTMGRHTLTHNLSDFQRRVHLPHLVRVHRSYIVNVSHVDSFDEGYIYIGEHKIPTSKTYRNEFLATLNAI